MSNPTRGTLHLSNGMVIDDCNPAFLFSEDSRYLAVPHWHLAGGLFRRQRLLVVDLALRQCFISRQSWWLVQPESFSCNGLATTANPTSRRPRAFTLPIPEALDFAFRPWHPPDNRLRQQ